MYKVDANSRWRIHCSGPDFTWIIYDISKFHGVMHTWSCVRGYARAGRPVGSLESAVISGEAQNGVYKAMVGVSPDSFVVSKYTANAFHSSFFFLSKPSVVTDERIT